MDANEYIALSCAIALAGGVVPLFRRRFRLAAALAVAGPVTVMLIPTIMSWFIGLQTPGVAMVWLYAMPLAAIYVAAASLIAAFLPRRAKANV